MLKNSQQNPQIKLVTTSWEWKQWLNQCIFQRPKNFSQTDKKFIKHVNLFTQVCNHENVKLLPGFVFKGIRKGPSRRKFKQELMKSTIKDVIEI